MKIYFACAIMGGRGDEAVYQQLVAAMLADGHVVPTALNAGPGWQTLEQDPDPIEIYQRDMAWIAESQVMVAEISTPSHGVGYEIRYALEQAKPVLCLYQRQRKVSKMLTGNTMPNLTVHAYDTVDEALRLLRQFLAAAS